MRTPFSVATKPEMPDEHQLLQVQIGTIKCMLIDAYAKYSESWNQGDRLKAERFDGYIRALHQVLEEHGL